ncbi:MAG: hypothetical protein JJU00_13975 [Opitutales bacterium]|nr:hypothetical protein [Opitutales bacterium]
MPRQYVSLRRERRACRDAVLLDRSRRSYRRSGLPTQGLAATLFLPARQWASDVAPTAESADADGEAAPATIRRPAGAARFSRGTRAWVAPSTPQLWTTCRLKTRVDKRINR